MIFTNYKLPQSRMNLKTAQWGIDQLEKQLQGYAFRFHVLGVAAALRTVQHALIASDRNLTPDHARLIDDWKRNTPLTTPELAFIMFARNNILKAGRFEAYAVSSQSRTGGDDNYEVTSTSYEMEYYNNEGERRELLPDFKWAAAWCDKQLTALETLLPYPQHKDEGGR